MKSDTKITGLNILSYGRVLSDSFSQEPIRNSLCVVQSGPHFSHANANKSIPL